MSFTKYSYKKPHSKMQPFQILLFVQNSIIFFKNCGLIVCFIFHDFVLSTVGMVPSSSFPLGRRVFIKGAEAAGVELHPFLSAKCP